jgi:hypothetical protein
MLSHQDFLDECARGLQEHRLKGQIISPELRTERIPFSPGMRLQVAAFSIRRKVTLQ